MGGIGRDELKYSLEPYVRRADSAISRILRENMGNPFAEPLIEFTRGGKKIRPALLLLVNEAVGGGGDPDPAAAAVELIHLASLIHDDIIDDSSMRRDLPSFHVKHGIEMAILIADFILSLVLEIANRYDDRRVGKLISETTKLMSIGEIMEVILLKEGIPISLNDYLRVLKYKTASLFQTASSLGALIAGKDHLVERMGSYGLYLGLAYQIKDDILDWGKEGELTCLLKEDVRSQLASLASRFADSAIDTLTSIPESPQKDILRKLIVYSVEREE
ncbi:MAG: polyprenyl synthetase family protein [Candidatus Korarchaeum sp.]|nr:polyprenyl synthetase family protein [Candidatus Korarchaeum sp.]MDW8035536.1 polyprenyl synthetase family protein [Candidatus Korarchaeum sp.]